ELLRMICDSLVEHGGFQVAWIGWHDPATGRLEPVAAAGDDDGAVRRREARAGDRSAAALAFREGGPQVRNDLRRDPLEPGGHPGPLSACVALPIRSGGQVTGVLSAYASEPD